MVHRERRDPKGEFFWACFIHGVFVDSDRFGALPRLNRDTARWWPAIGTSPWLPEGAICKP